MRSFPEGASACRTSGPGAVCGPAHAARSSARTVESPRIRLRPSLCRSLVPVVFKGFSNAGLFEVGEVAMRELTSQVADDGGDFLRIEHGELVPRMFEPVALAVA